MWTGHRYWWDWPDHWFGWQAKIEGILPYTKGLPVWVTESGYATCKGNTPTSGGFTEQSLRLSDAIRAPVDRLYWYCVRDMPYNYACIEMTEDGGRIDYREYHLGLTTVSGKRKLAWHTLSRLLDEGVEHGEPGSSAFQPVVTAPVLANYPLKQARSSNQANAG
jgi:CDP-paratose 2-epimerase